MPDFFLKRKNRILLTAAGAVIILLPLLAWKGQAVINLLKNPGSQLKLAPSVLNCPVAEDVCKNGTGLEISSAGSKKESLGIGWKLASGSALLASFDGTLTAQSTFGGKKPPIVYLLTNQSQTYQAGYLFIPDAPLTVTQQETLAKGRQVKKGEVIATLPGSTLEEMGYKNINFQFFLIDFKKKERVPTLSVKDFGTLNLL